MKKEKKNDLTFILIFIIGVTLSFAFLFQSSYAKYKKQISGDVKFSIAEWNIYLNNENITGKDSLENNLIPIYDKNDYIKENAIAPGSTGYVDLNIDATNVDVTFAYSIETSIPDESVVKDLKITHYQIAPENETSTKIVYDGTTPITGTILHNTPTTTIRLFIIWDDSETNTMDNTTDTLAATNSKNQGIIKTTINFIQKK